MSKSLGNVVTQKVMDQMVPIFCACGWSALTITAIFGSDQIIKRTTDNYRRFRNTLRYLLVRLTGSRTRGSQLKCHGELGAASPC